MTSTPSVAPARIALVGDRTGAVAAHSRIPQIVQALRARDGLVIDPYWVPTTEAARPDRLVGFDGIWLLPGSPYRSQEGALAAARTARVGGIPFLGTCGGFQHAVLEFARAVCELTDVAHGEVTPEAPRQVIVPLTCSLQGHEGEVRIQAGTLAERVFGAERALERYYCSYGVCPAFLGELRRGGLCFSGVDDAGDVRIVELPGHPFFLGTLFQPELSSDATRAHPVIGAFAAAAATRAARRSSASPATLSAS